MITLLDTECILKYKFEELVLDLNEEKSLVLESLLKKYRDALGIGTNLESLVVTNTTSTTPLSLSTEVKGAVTFIIEISHDSKG